MMTTLSPSVSTLLPPSRRLASTVAGGWAAQRRHHRNMPHIPSPRRAWQHASTLSGSDFPKNIYRWCRCAQPPATVL